MKASTNGEVNGKVHEVTGETNEKLRKVTDDPTLEGKDENKVGRIQRRIGRAEKALPSAGVRRGSDGPTTARVSRRRQGDDSRSGRTEEAGPNRGRIKSMTACLH
jgi:uncharacterized protein YjbJ (UPF0337 family)